MSSAVDDFEKLGAFYLGRPFNLSTEKEDDQYLLYESRHLTTHAVVVGMTGSGKTGLCIDLIEEAAIDNIPVIAIDPKGDISNVLLAFENLSPAEFQPWVSAEDAQLNGQSVDEFAVAQSKIWQDGIANYDQDKARIKRLKDSADFAIYTPFSSAGIQLSVLKSFSCPEEDILDDAESLREHVSVACQSLLSLAGITSDPLRGRESIFLGTLIQSAWKNHQDLTLIDLVRMIQTPPITQIGALDLESFFAKKDRFELAMSINNLIASPGFEGWMTGEPLDISRLLYSETGKPQVSVISISHLQDTERMFFVSLLLNQIVSWMRSQTGTSSLRAILYMDEIFGYFPPVANPPSKQPLLTLLKQARAYGVGVVLATQNPVDLDYKGLSNAGTWFVGRLQTERDKLRLIDGLESVASEHGTNFDRDAIDKMLSSLKKRVFLLHNTNGDGLLTFKTRFTLSYLRGPLSKLQIKRLMETKKQASTEQKARVESSESNTVKAVAEETKTAQPESADGNSRPILPPDVSQYVLPIKKAIPESARIIYAPCLLTNIAVRFTDIKTKLDHSARRTWLLPVSEEPVGVRFDESTQELIAERDLSVEPLNNAQFIRPPEWMFQAKNYKIWNKKFLDWLLLREKHFLLVCPPLKLNSNVDETDRDFRIRVRERARELRDSETALLVTKYRERLSVQENKVRLAEQAVEREDQQRQAQDMQTAISIGATVFGAILGGRRRSSSIGRVTSAARAATRSAAGRSDVERAHANLEAAQQKLSEIESQVQQEVTILRAKYDQIENTIETTTVTAKKTNISIDLFSFAWAPYQLTAEGKYIPLWRAQ